ncbi:MAG TPA: serine/threonine-protein kinase, partial [Kofleriaceae bacterium]|nr:serine/threonine-protein kinase [Kofleriaceae bacterium]
MAGPGSCAAGAAACIAPDQAHAFVAGGLLPTERAAIERRIDACTRCRAAVVEAAREMISGTASGTAGRTASGAATGTATGAANRSASGTNVERVHGPESRVVTPLALDATRPGAPPFASTQQLRGPGTEPRRLPPATGDVPGTVDRRRAGRDEGSGVAGDRDLVPGEVVGRYIVERPLGAGGMGVVSLARDPELRRPVVIKLVHPNMGHGEGGDELEARLRREAQAMAQLSHANVVQIFDIGRRGDRVFLAMEFIAGTTLDGWLRERPRSAEEILGMLRQAGEGLAAAHKAGLVHRDFKPSNVLVGEGGVAKVTDFGLARAVGGPEGEAAASPAITRQLRVPSAPRPSGVHAILTDANSVVGTPAYMAPEQAAGRAIDARTDQYAFAITLLDALLGQAAPRRAIEPTAPPAAIDAALERAGIAPPIRAAVLRALSEDPAARFPAIDELLDALAVAAPAPDPRPHRRSAPIVAGVIALALGGGGAYLWLSHRHTA